MVPKIKAISYYLPDEVLTNEEIASIFTDWSAEKIATKVGIETRHIASDNTTSGDMAFYAAEKLFEEHSIDRNQIDFLILCTQSPDYPLPPTACILQSRLNLSSDCGAFDINLGCSGYIYLLALAKGLIIGGLANNVLLLTAETYTKYISESDKGNRTLFGDGATATLISRDGFAEIGEFELGTDGKGYDKLIVMNGGARSKCSNNHPICDANGAVIDPAHLYMDGKSIFDFSSDVVPQLVSKVLKKNNLTLNDIDLTVLHQANKYMINYLRKLLEIDKEKFFIFMKDVGNTVSSTIPIALYEARSQNRLKGDVLIAGFGVGLSWGATVLRCL